MSDYTFNEILLLLETTRSVVASYLVSCDHLDGEPLVPNNKPPLFSPHKFPSKQVNRIQRVWKQAKKGRVFVYGCWWLSEKRTLRRLRKIRGDGKWGVGKSTLQRWRTEACPHLPDGRLLKSKLMRLRGERGRAPVWHLEADLVLIEKALRALEKGCYTTPDGHVFTSKGAAQQMGCSKNTVNNRVRRALLDPHYTRNRRGRPSTRDENLKRVYTEAVLKGANQSSDASWDGTWDNGTRIGLSMAGDLLGINRRNMHVLIDESATKQLLRADTRLPPGGGKPQWTVLREGVLQLKRIHKAAVDEARRLKAAKWQTKAQIEKVYRRSGTVLYAVFKVMRAKGPEYAKRILWPVPLGRQKSRKSGPDKRLRELWVYHLPKFKVLLECKESDSVGEEPSGNGHAESGEHAAVEQNRGGRPMDEETWKLYEFCYEKYVTDDLGSATVKSLANKRFGENTIKEEAHVRLYARRYAKKFGKPRKQQKTSGK
jgi:hypothetical protein